MPSLNHLTTTILPPLLIAMASMNALAPSSVGDRHNLVQGHGSIICWWPRLLPCQAMTRQATARHAKPRHKTPLYAKPRQATARYAKPCQATEQHAMQQHNHVTALYAKLWHNDATPSCAKLRHAMPQPYQCIVHEAMQCHATAHTCQAAPSHGL